MGDRERRVSVEHGEIDRLVGRPGESLKLGHGDASQIERALGPVGQANDDEPESIFARFVILFDQTALLERREEPRCGRLVEAEATRELGYARFPLALAEREEERGRPIDGPNGIAVEAPRRVAPLFVNSSEAGRCPKRGEVDWFGAHRGRSSGSLLPTV